jgi:hypothetical protein
VAQIWIGTDSCRPLGSHGGHSPTASRPQ